MQLERWHPLHRVRFHTIAGNHGATHLLRFHGKHGWLINSQKNRRLADQSFASVQSGVAQPTKKH